MTMLLLRCFWGYCSILAFALNAKETNSSFSMYTMEQVPYGYVDKNGKTSGVLFDILEQIILESGLELTNELAPTKRLEFILTTKNNGCTLLADVPNIRKNLDLVEPIDYELKVGVLPKVGVTLVDYASLKEKVLAVPRGIDFDEKFDNDIELLKVNPPTYLHGVRMLKAGRVDAVVGAISNIMFVAKVEGMFQDDFSAPLVFATNHVHLVCSKDINKGIRKKLKQAIISLKSKGSIQETLDKYFRPIRYSKID